MNFSEPFPLRDTAVNFFWRFPFCGVCFGRSQPSLLFPSLFSLSRQLVGGCFCETSTRFLFFLISLRIAVASELLCKSALFWPPAFFQGPFLALAGRVLFFWAGVLRGWTLFPPFSLFFSRREFRSSSLRASPDFPILGSPLFYFPPHSQLPPSGAFFRGVRKHFRHLRGRPAFFLNAFFSSVFFCLTSPPAIQLPQFSLEGGHFLIPFFSLPPHNLRASFETVRTIAVR